MRGPFTFTEGFFSFFRFGFVAPPFARGCEGPGSV
jgi:hypothetical protein